MVYLFSKPSDGGTEPRPEIGEEPAQGGERGVGRGHSRQREEGEGLVVRELV